MHSSYDPCGLFSSKLLSLWDGLLNTVCRFNDPWLRMATNSCLKLSIESILEYCCSPSGVRAWSPTTPPSSISLSSFLTSDSNFFTVEGWPCSSEATAVHPWKSGATFSYWLPERTFEHIFEGNTLNLILFSPNLSRRLIHSCESKSL